MRYCSRECQREDWNLYHSQDCTCIQRISPHQPTQTILLMARLLRLRMANAPYKVGLDDKKNKNNSSQFYLFISYHILSYHFIHLLLSLYWVGIANRTQLWRCGVSSSAYPLAVLLFLWSLSSLAHWYYFHNNYNSFTPTKRSPRSFPTTTWGRVWTSG